MENFCKKYCYFYKPNKTYNDNERCGTYKFLKENSFILSQVTPKKDISNNEINKKIIELFCKEKCDYYIKDCDWTDFNVKEKIAPCGGYYFIYELFSKFPILNDDFFIKKLEKTYLFDRKNDELYEIDDLALNFFSKCNGENKLYEIIVDVDSVCYLLENNIISLKEESSFKNIKIPEKNSPIPSLRYLEIQLTHRCNLKCLHCYLGKSKDIEMDFNLLKKILDEFEEINGIRVIFSGGEPFLYSKIYDLLEILENYSFRRVFLTNGTLIKEDLLKNIDEIQISIDGFEDSHDFLRGKGTFEKIVENIEIIKKKNIPISIETMIYKKNLNDFDKLENFIKKIGAIEWGIDVPVVDDALKVTPEKAKPILQKKFGGSFHEPLSGFACGVHLATVFPDGKIAKCGFYKNQPFGDLNKESLESALQKRKFIKLTDLECAKINCKFLNECRGGCRFRAPTQFSPDPYMCFIYSS